MPSQKNKVRTVAPVEKVSRFATTKGGRAQLASVAIAINDAITPPAAENAPEEAILIKPTLTHAPNKASQTKVGNDETLYDKIISVKPLVVVPDPYLIEDLNEEITSVMNIRMPLAFKDTIQEHCHVTKTNPSVWCRRAISLLLSVEQDAIKKLKEPQVVKKLKGK